MLNKIPDEVVTAVYRGWMMQPEQYESFYQSLLENKIQLITTHEEYRRFHVFPNIYPLLEEDTAGMIIFPENTPVDLDTVRRSFKRFMVKDYVKSVKGTDFPVYFRIQYPRKNSINGWKCFISIEEICLPEESV